MKKPLVIGNWKMHGSIANNRDLILGLMDRLPALERVDVVICPPFPYLIPVRAQLTDLNVALGAQNLSAFDSGAHTGEVSAPMLRDLACRYVLVGHSERRSLYGESDSQIADKVASALAAELTPVICVGETIEARQADQTESVIRTQLEAVLDKVGIERFAKAVIAYEPVWAIGTGETASPAMAQKVHHFIRQLLAERDAEIAGSVAILYGGSVKADNAAALFAQPDIDGGLIGGASLEAGAFSQICAAASA